jgi:hypothetical protein
MEEILVEFTLDFDELVVSVDPDNKDLSLVVEPYMPEGEGGGAIKVRELDNTPSIYPVIELVAPNGSVEDLGDGKVRLNKFNGNRAIKRNVAGLQGLNVNTADIHEFIEEVFFPFVPATAYLGGGSLHEVGSNPTINVSGGITPNDETIFSNRRVLKSNGAWETFAGNSFSIPDVVNLNDAGSVPYQVFVDVGNSGSPTTIQSGISNVDFVFPFLWGVSANGSVNPYTLTKNVSYYGNKAVAFSGLGVYLYFAYPTSYPDLISVRDPNGFEALPNMTKSVVTVNSVGLPVNWSRAYKVYRWNTLADFSGTYQFLF